MPDYDHLTDDQLAVFIANREHQLADDREELAVFATIPYDAALRRCSTLSQRIAATTDFLADLYAERDARLKVAP